MEIDIRSSSNDLSSAPSSDVEGPFPSHPNSAHHNTILNTSAYGATTPAQAVSSVAKAERVAAHSSATRQDGPPVKQRKPRKKKEVDPNAPPAPEKEKKPRKPRASAGTTTTSSRKRVKTENDPPASVVTQTLLQSNDLSSSRLVQPLPFVSDSKTTATHEAAKTTQLGFSTPNSAMMSQPQSPTQPRQQVVPPPRARNIFDPVRGIERSSEPTPAATYPTLNETPPHQPFRPSASPAISSIINHPDVKPAIPLTYQPGSRNSGRPMPVEETITVNGATSTLINLEGSSSSEAPPKRASPVEKSAPETENKQKRAKEQPPPAPIGSGLLNSTFFGGDSADKAANDGKSVNIVLQIDLNDDKNKVFNFARMAEDKYGFAAVYPRQAAQRKRLAEVAAVGAALEKLAPNGKRGELSLGDSGEEDSSADVDHDSDNDGDIAMSGVNGTNENSGTDGPLKKTRKKRKDEYDADDPFVDDSEMLWEAQAATSKDGFFVYMGPLVPEGEKTSVERAEGTISKRGRGRGRGGGPGSRGGRGAASAAGGETSSRRGGGPGSRGGGLTRKPRITKAERAQRELEKEQREQAATSLASRPTPAPN